MYLFGMVSLRTENKINADVLVMVLLLGKSQEKNCMLIQFLILELSVYFHFFTIMFFYSYEIFSIFALHNHNAYYCVNNKKHSAHNHL